jgi:hypothetical protein
LTDVTDQEHRAIVSQCPLTGRPAARRAGA